MPVARQREVDAAEALAPRAGLRHDHAAALERRRRRRACGRGSATSTPGTCGQAAAPVLVGRVAVRAPAASLSRARCARAARPRRSARPARSRATSALAASTGDRKRRPAELAASSSCGTAGVHTPTMPTRSGPDVFTTEAAKAGGPSAARTMLAASHGNEASCARSLASLGAVGELVVADRHRVVAHAAHRRHHRLGARAVAALVQRLERAALDGVAVVEQQRGSTARARGVDQRRDLHQPARRRPVGEVVVGGERAVQVGGVEDGEARLLGAGRRTARRENARASAWRRRVGRMGIADAITAAPRPARNRLWSGEC